MRKVVLFIAMSLDGYIADRHGGVDWLSGQSETAAENDSYAAFIRDIDTVIMGWNTYHQIVTELSPEEWVYEGLQSYVVTHRACESTRSIRFTPEKPRELVEKLRQEPGKDIWICGGASIVRQLMEADAIDRFHISMIPTLLGGGIRLFDTLAREQKLSLVKSRADNGIVELIYEKRAGCGE